MIKLGDRYFVSGTQLGVIQGLIEGGSPERVKDTLQEIFDKQYIGTKEEFEKKFAHPKIVKDTERREILSYLKNLSNTTETQLDLFRRLSISLKDYWANKEGENGIRK